MSDHELGKRLSAFNLSFKAPNSERTISVECAFQASKVFEKGGPFLDLQHADPADAKRDPRLQQSGRLTGFQYFGTEWSTEPPTALYDWIYINALHLQEELASELLEFDAFTDIAFNPAKSINCQAKAAALYVALRKKKLIDEAISSREAFIQIENGEFFGQGKLI